MKQNKYSLNTIAIMCGVRFSSKVIKEKRVLSIVLSRELNFLKHKVLKTNIIQAEYTQSNGFMGNMSHTTTH